MTPGVPVAEGLSMRWESGIHPASSFALTSGWQTPLAITSTATWRARVGARDLANVRRHVGGPP
jgi:hypothetical protein